MQEFEGAYTKDSLVESLAIVRDTVHQHFSVQNTSEFFANAGDSWPQAGKLDHLIRAVQPLVQALRLPKFSIRMMFGNAQEKSKSYTEIREIYLAKLAGGAKAAGRFVPKLPDEGNAQEQQQILLKRWDAVSQDLIDAIQGWAEKDLDVCRLPHPILGKITVREMLLFTLYHNYHHLKS